MRAPGFALLLAPLSVLSCGTADRIDAETDAPKVDPFSSNQATLLDFELDGELVVPNTPWSPSRLVEEQLLYTIGHLNADLAVGRLDRLELSNVRTDSVASGKRIRYHAKLPVAWGKKTNLPTAYTFELPRRADKSGLEAFTDKYKEDCVDWGAHDVDAGSMWYYFRPHRSGCQLSTDDIVSLDATVSVSQKNTSGKYPEYHKVWEDGSLRVVAIFGKYEDGATDDSDAGIAGYNRFVSRMKAELGSDVVTTPASLPANPGVAVPDVTLAANVAGREVQVVALLVDNVRTAPASFDTRYEELSGNADLIFYNGHAGLGANVRALSQKGHFLPGKYQIFFMNGCDTFAYVDGSLTVARAELNFDDPAGSKYLDMVTNAMPSFFSNMPDASLALVRGLLAKDTPKTYEQIFRDVSNSQVVVVTGEEDNVYYPGYGEGSDEGWQGLTKKGTVAGGETMRWASPTLPAGQYLFELTHDPQAPGGDADLYVRAGSAPSMSSYDCRPYLGGSQESCTITLTAPANIYVMVYGYDAGSSAFVLSGRARASGGDAGWSGFSHKGALERDQESLFETPLLAEGNYRFAIDDDPAHPGGDADLYVKVGQSPTMQSYDCRPYLDGSQEECLVTLSAPAKIFVKVRAYSTNAAFVLTGEKR